MAQETPLPPAWVVDCTGCRCVIVIAAIDPQTEHMHPTITPPVTSAVLGCTCCGSAYRYSSADIYRGVPGKANCRRKKDPIRLEGALLVAASVVAAIRLAREEDWSNSPRVAARISDSINLAKRVCDRIKDDLPRSS